MNRQDVAIKAVQLTRRFGKFTAVDAISFDVKRGEVFGFLGANGAGKTTAIRMFCGLLKPSEGDAYVANISVRQDPRSIKRRIGYMSQKFSLYEELMVEENLDFFAGAYNLRAEEANQRKEEILEQFSLSNLRRRLTRSLPLGWKQRLALGCALLHNPEITKPVFDANYDGTIANARDLKIETFASQVKAYARAVKATGHGPESEHGAGKGQPKTRLKLGHARVP